MKKVLIILALLVGGQVNAQELTLKDAMKIAIEKNLNIQISGKSVERATNGATKGNAGMMPKVDLNGGGTYGQSVTDLTFAGNVPPIEDATATSISYNGTVQASYVLYNGMRATNTYAKLKTQSDLAQIQFNLTTESTILQVCNVYYEVARQQEQLGIAKNSLTVSKDRYERVVAGAEYGAATKLEVLNAQVDMNTDSSNVINMTAGLNNAKRNLNMLLGRDIGTVYRVDEKMQINEAILLEDVKAAAMKNNINLMLSQTNIQLGELDEKIQKAFYMPRVGLTGSYGYNYSESDASLILSQKNLGFTGGVTLAWNLFDGFKTKTAIQDAKIAMESNALKMQEAEQAVEKDYLNAYELYKSNLSLLRIEEQGVAAAEWNFERSAAMFKEGQLTTTAFRSAQLNLNRAKSRLNTTKFTTKMAEIELLRLKGDLVKRG